MPAFAIAAAERRASAQPARRRVLSEPLRFLHRHPRPDPGLRLGELWALVLYRVRRRQRAAARPPLRPRNPARDDAGGTRLPAPKAHTRQFDQTEKYSLLNLEPPGHTRLRTLVNRAFVSRHVERLRPRIEALANELIDAFEPQGEVEPAEAFAAPLPAIVIAEMIGLPADMAAQLVAWSNRMVQMYMFGVTEATEHDRNGAATEFMDYLKGVIAERRPDAAAGPAEPYADRRRGRAEAQRRRSRLDRHPAAQCRARSNRPTPPAMRSSRSSRAGSTRRALFANPEQTEATVEECLRFDAPLHMFTRFALQDVDIEDGIKVKKGEVIGLMLGAANRDPDPLRPMPTASIRSAPTAPCQLRRRHPFLLRRAAGPDRAAGGRCRRCSSACRRCAWRRRRATTTSTISTGSSGSTSPGKGERDAPG